MSTTNVDVHAVKKAEHSDYTIVRLQELLGEKTQAGISFASRISEAYEVDGQERRIGDAQMQSGKLICDLNASGIRSFAIKLENPDLQLTTPASEPVTLKYNGDVISTEDNNRDGNMESGHTIPAELWPAEIVNEGIRFKMGSPEDGRHNILDCNGQTVSLPKAGYNRLYILAASAISETSGVFRIGQKRI